MPRPFAVIGFTVFFTIALLFNSGIGAIASMIGVFSVALAASLFIPEARRQRVLPCAFASGIVACILLISEVGFFYLPAVSFDGKTCHITAQLTDYPEFRYGNYYYDAETVVIDGEKAEHKLRLVFKSSPDAEPFDLVEGDFTFYVLGSSSEEMIASNKAKGVFIGAYPQNGLYTVTHIPESEKPFMKTVVDVREEIKNTVNRAVPGDSGSLLTALIIGDKSNLSSDIQNDFRMSGVTHIICVSGLHLSLWTMIILEILKLLKVNERIASIVAAVGVIGFMLVAGMTYSVVRSGIMTLIYLFGNVVWKKRDSLNSLGFSLVVISVYNPFAMGSVGLQLSALSTLGLILFSQLLKPRIDGVIDKINHKWLSKSLKHLVSSICIPVAATLFTLPVSLRLYDEFNFAVFATNLLIVPLASFCMIVGILAALICFISTGIPNVFAYVADFSATLLIKIAGVFADFDLLVFRGDSDCHVILICGIFLVIAAAIFVTYAGKNVFKITSAICVIIFVSGLLISSVSHDCETRINVIDVGNGTAVLASKNNENILIGCGGSEFLGASRITDEILHYGGKIDTLLLPDAEKHSASYLNDILLRYRPERVGCDDLPSGSELLLGSSEIYGFSEITRSDNFSFKSDGENCLFLESEDMSALICFNPSFDYSVLPQEFKTADVIITRNDYPDNIETENCRLVVVNSENSRGITIQEELSARGIRGVATGGCGNILIRGESGFVSVNRT